MVLQISNVLYKGINGVVSSGGRKIYEGPNNDGRIFPFYNDVEEVLLQDTTGYFTHNLYYPNENDELGNIFHVYLLDTKRA